MEYQEKFGQCKKHGFTIFIKQYSGWICGECMGEDSEEIISKEIEIVAELNLNEVSI
jgi:hypothetical protein